MKEYQRYLNEKIGDEIPDFDNDKRLFMFKTYKDYTGKEVSGLFNHFPKEKFKLDSHGNIDKDSPFFDDPKIRWFKEGQSGGISEIDGKRNASWGSAIIALFPDGYWTIYSQDYDSSG
jgi:hypothetical protein